MKSVTKFLKYAVFALVAAAMAFASCKKEEEKYGTPYGVNVNYRIDANFVVLNGADTVKTGDMVKRGTRLSIVPLPTDKGATSVRRLDSISINGSKNLVGDDKLQVTYSVKEDDKVINITGITMGGNYYPPIKFDNTKLLIISDDEREIEYTPGDSVDADWLVIISLDGSPITSITINEKTVMYGAKNNIGIEWVSKKHIAFYNVQKEILKNALPIDIEVTLQAQTPPPTASTKLAYTNVKVADANGNDLPTGTEVKEGDKITIKPIDGQTKFETLVVNGGNTGLEIATDKTSATYTVQAGETEVKIEATYPAAAATITLTFDKSVVLVDGKNSGDAVQVSDVLTIKVAEATKTFETLKINSTAIADATDKTEYAYTVQAGDTQVTIEATLK